MKTAELIETLAAQATPLPPARPGRRLAVALAIGGTLALALLVVWLGGPLPAIASRPWFWMKTAYAAALMAPASLMVARLSRPGAPLKLAPLSVVVAAILLMAAVGCAQLLHLAPEQRLTAWRGATWTVCSPRILLLSVPIQLCVLAALRTLAPTDLPRAGAAAGFLSGSLAAMLYALHCPEHGVAFVATWYSLGILAATVLGAAAGRLLLRW
jgi:hypothetical protein